MQIHSILIGVAVCLPVASLFAQDEKSYGIFDTRDAYYEFMGNVKEEGASNPELMAMVPMINDIVLGQPIGSTGKQYNATSSTLGLLADESVRKELEMVDEQFADLQKANEQIQKRMADQLRGLDLTDMKSATAQILAIRDQSEKELQATLLPHQMKRLRQLMVQNQLRRRSLVEILTSEPWRSQLEISNEQADKLRDSEVEIAKDLERQIAELREKARQRLLGTLENRQRKQVEEMFGDAYEFSQPKEPRVKGSRRGTGRNSKK